MKDGVKIPYLGFIPRYLNWSRDILLICNIYVRIVSGEPTCFEVAQRQSRVLLTPRSHVQSVPSKPFLTEYSASLVKRLVLETRFRWFKSNYSDHLLVVSISVISVIWLSRFVWGEKTAGSNPAWRTIYSIIV